LRKTFWLKFAVCAFFWVALPAACGGARGTAEGPPTPDRTASIAPLSAAGLEGEDYFQGGEGAFVLYDLQNDQYLRYNAERCAERFLPASTFKIMNSLIGLESGVIPDENFVIPWDGTPYPIPSWNRDHTLATAIRNSVVWYYQELSRRVGRDRMQSYVDAAGYGNRDISGPIDAFWLEGGLRISADEQVEFLRRLYLDELPFSAGTMRIVRKILVLEETESYQFSGKTGSVQRVPPHTGWFVGYLTVDGNTYFFATNYERSDPEEFASGEEAKTTTWNILKGLGLLPGDG
jgi:beta-lactamase class D